MIFIKSAEELAKMRKAGRVVAQILNELSQKAKPGVSTEALDKAARKIISANNAQAAFLGYRGYPKSICTSVNDEVVHGIPGQRILKNGDILSIDVGVFLDGYCADAALTVPVGKVGKETKDLLEAGEQSLNSGIAKCLAANRLSDISSEIQVAAEARGFSVVRDLVGHGIGRSMHEEPQVPNFGKAGKGPLLKKGMVLALEPMLNEGTFDVKVLQDGWTVVTEDGKLSCHFEHSVAITGDGPEVLTCL